MYGGYGGNLVIMGVFPNVRFQLKSVAFCTIAAQRLTASKVSARQSLEPLWGKASEPALQAG